MRTTIILPLMMILVMTGQARTAATYFAFKDLELNFTRPDATVRLCGSIFGRVIDLVCFGTQLTWMDYYKSLDPTPEPVTEPGAVPPIRYQFVAGAQCCAKPCTRDDLLSYCRKDAR